MWMIHQAKGGKLLQFHYVDMNENLPRVNDTGTKNIEIKHQKLCLINVLTHNSLWL